MDLAREIQVLATSLLENNAHFVVDVILTKRGGPQKVLVIMDGDEGIGIDDCALISRSLSKALDDKNLLEEHYTLEVSSPGLDQPLKLLRQYKKNLGRGLKVKKTDKTVLEGKLTDATEEGITLLVASGKEKKKEDIALDVPFSEIDKAFVLVSFK